MKFVKVAAAQYPISFFSHFQDWQLKIEKWVNQAIQQKAQFLVFPEYGSMELTSLFDEADRKNLNNQAYLLKSFIEPFKLTFQNLARQHKLYIIAPSFPVWQSEDLTTNRVFIFNPEGKIEYQDKLFMTRFEDEKWNIKKGEPQIKVFKTELFNFSVSTCFDIEFAAPSQIAAYHGAQVIFAPSCTEKIKGAHRVHIGARARALENQCYVVVSQTVGEALWSQAVDLNYGFSGFYSTPDLGFSDDGIIHQGRPNEVEWGYAELKMSLLEKVRNQGAVFNYKWNQCLYPLDKHVFEAKIIDF